VGHISVSIGSPCEIYMCTNTSKYSLFNMRSTTEEETFSDLSSRHFRRDEDSEVNPRCVFVSGHRSLVSLASILVYIHITET